MMATPSLATRCFGEGFNPHDLHQAWCRRIESEYKSGNNLWSVVCRHLGKRPIRVRRHTAEVQLYDGGLWSDADDEESTQDSVAREAESAFQAYLRQEGIRSPGY